MMNNESRALVQAITGPIILITVGSLFALDKSFGYPFHQTWPVLIIVIGCLKLFGGRRRGLFQNGCATRGRTFDPNARQQYAPPPAGPQSGHQQPSYDARAYNPTNYDPSAPPPPAQPGVRQ